MKDMTPEEIMTVLKKEKEGVLAFTDGEKPYAIPIGHVCVNEMVYFSIFAKGRKWELYQKNPRVCFTVFGWNGDRTGWRSAMVEGQMTPVSDFQEIEAVVRANIVKSNRDPEEHLKKRMQYYIDNEANPKAVKVFKIEPTGTGGRKSSHS